MIELARAKVKEKALLITYERCREKDGRSDPLQRAGDRPFNGINLVVGRSGDAPPRCRKLEAQYDAQERFASIPRLRPLYGLGNADNDGCGQLNSNKEELIPYAVWGAAGIGKPNGQLRQGIPWAHAPRVCETPGEETCQCALGAGGLNGVLIRWLKVAQLSRGRVEGRGRSRDWLWGEGH